jgi:hypothetical protein
MLKDTTALACKGLRFLYSHLPGPLHYTFAFFLLAVAVEREGDGLLLGDLYWAIFASGDLASRRRISNQIGFKRGETWQPLTRK